MSTLRDAAHALRAAIQRHCRAGQLTAIEPELTALFLAADAPPPAPDELRGWLWNLWHHGRATADLPPSAWDAMGAERDRLIAELLAMWPRRDEDDLR